MCRQAEPGSVGPVWGTVCEGDKGWRRGAQGASGYRGVDVVLRYKV